mgnify:CR=1 FL=1
MNLGWERIFADFGGGQEGTRQQRLREILVASIEDGKLVPGTRLPSSRSLMSILGVSRNTVVQALEQLIDSGHLVTRPRSGIFVAGSPALETAVERPIAPPAAEERTEDWWAGTFAVMPSRLRHISKPADWNRYPYPFLFGQMDPTLFPTREWRESARSVSSVAGIGLWASDRIDEDDPKLIEQLRAHVLPRRGIWARQEEIMVTLGAQQALSLVIRLLTGPETVFGVEDPGYPDARHMAQLLTSHLRLLTVDGAGAMPDARFAECDVAMLTPGHQCPTTVAMSRERQVATLEAARRHDIVLIEDDYDANLFDEGANVGTLKSLDRDGRVIHIGSFSKLIAPGLRIGYVVAPKRVIEELRVLRRLELRHPPLNNQRILASFIALGHYRAHMNRLGAIMLARARAMDSALADHLPTCHAVRAQGATSAWVELPPDVDATALVPHARREGVLIEAGDVFFAHKGRGTRHMRLGFTSIPEERIAAGIRRLNRMMNHQG